MRFSKRRLAKNRCFEMSIRSWVNNQLELAEKNICIELDSTDFLSSNLFKSQIENTDQIEQVSKRLSEIFEKHNLCRYENEVRDAIAIDHRQFKDRESKKKFLCIGQNKSASTMLSHLFSSRGYSVCTNSHWMIDYGINGIDSKYIRKNSFLSDGEPINIPIFRLVALHLSFDAYFIAPIRPLEGWLVSRWNHIQREKNNSNGVCKSYSSPDNREYDVLSWIVQREINCRRFLLMKAMFPDISLNIFHIDDINRIVNNRVDFNRELNLRNFLQRFFPLIFLDSIQNKTNSFSTRKNYNHEPKEIGKLMEKYNLGSYKNSIILPASIFCRLYQEYNARSLLTIERRATFSL